MLATPTLSNFDKPSLPSSEGGDPALAARLKPLYSRFLTDLDLQPEYRRHESEKLMEEVLKFAKSTGVPHDLNSHSYQSLMVGYTYADVSFLSLVSTVSRAHTIFRTASHIMTLKSRFM